MKYPCIVYNKSNKMNLYGSDVIHFSKQEYQVTVIDKNPDSDIANQVEKTLPYCGIDRYSVIDNLNHTYLSLYY